MDERLFIDKCKEIIIQYYNSPAVTITKDDIFVVWACKTLQNNKALLSTTLPDGLYFELTHNGDREEIYFDAYSKVLNECHRLR